MCAPKRVSWAPGVSLHKPSWCPTDDAEDCNDYLKKMSRELLAQYTNKPGVLNSPYKFNVQFAISNFKKEFQTEDSNFNKEFKRVFVDEFRKMLPKMQLRYRETGRMS